MIPIIEVLSQNHKRMVASRVRAGEDRELLFNSRVSVLQDEKNYDDGW